MSNSSQMPDPVTNASLNSVQETGPALDIEEFQRLGYQAVDLLTDYLRGIDTHPVFRPMSPEKSRLLVEQPLSDKGTAPELLLQQFQEQMLPYATGNGHPRFFGWVNSPPAPLGILAEFLAAAQDPACDVGDIAALYLERCNVRWLMELVGFPVAGSMGLLVSGGSMASLTCLAVARQWATTTDGWNVRDKGLQGQHPVLTMYVSEESHSCLRKSVELLGIGSSALHVVPTNDFFKLDMQSLRRMVAADKAAGQRPFCVVATIGTTNTGAIDPLDELADFCAEQALWLHVDGAYGAMGLS